MTAARIMGLVLILPPSTVDTVDFALVVAAEVTQGTGTLAGEPITTATLHESNGHDRVVRIVGGPSQSGRGFVRLAGYVVPVVGARVRVDLIDDDNAASSSGSSSSIHAFTTNTPAGTWDPSKLPVTFMIATPRSRDLGEDAFAELDVAARTWGRVSCTSFRARFGGEQPGITAGDDGVNAVFFHDDAWPAELVPNALGQTVSHVDANGKLHDADIHINGADYHFSTNALPTALGEATEDIRSVFTHEIGHALGLGHSADPRATMNASGSGLRWRSLEKDDTDGVCSLYPGTGSAGCDVDPCPSGFVCVAAACQRRGDRTDVCSPCDPNAIANGACEAAGDEARCVDVTDSANAVIGRACGRACATDSDCGAGFGCRPTTESGDLQCLSLTGCKNGANTCTTDADCTQSGSACHDGACLDPAPVTIADAGTDAAAPDAATTPIRAPTATGNDCHCAAVGARRAARTRTSQGGVVLLLFLAMIRRRMRT